MALCVCCNLSFSDHCFAIRLGNLCMLMHVRAFESLLVNRLPSQHLNTQTPPTCELTQCSMQPSGESESIQMTVTFQNVLH